MASPFKFVITGVDKGTAVVRAFKNNLKAAAEPVTQLRTSMKSLGKELGFDKIAKGAGTLSKSVLGASRGLATLAPDLAIFGTLGSAAGPAGVILTTAAAVGVLTVKWADFGFDVKRTAQALGESTAQVQNWRNAGAALGVDAQSVDGSFQALGDSIQGAFAGRNNDTLFMMQRLHMQLKRTKSGAIDVNDEMMQLADIIQANNGKPQVQRQILSKFGVDPTMLPLLYKGRKGLQAQLAEAAKSSLSDADVEAGSNFDLSIKKWTVRAKGAFYKLSAAVGRQMTSPQKGMAIWSPGNPFGAAAADWGVRHGAAWGREHGAAAGNWLRSEFQTMTPAIVRMEHSLSGFTDFLRGIWGDVVGALAQISTTLRGLVPRLPAMPSFGPAGDVLGRIIDWTAKGITAFAGGAKNPTAAAYMGGPLAGAVSSYFKSKGLSAASTQGIVAGMFAEGVGKAGPNTVNPTSGAFGIGQWLGTRQSALFRQYGRSPNLQQQLDFMYGEMTRDPYEKRHGADIMAAPSAREAMRRYIEEFMRPGPGTGGDLSRGADALASVPGGKVDVAVTVHHNGTYASAKTTSSGTARARGTVVRSMGAVPA